MFILKILVQHKNYQLNKPFVYFSNVEVSLGCRVAITFHNQKIVGFINGIEDYSGTPETFKAEYGFEILEIDQIIDESAIINDELLELANTLSNYYVYPLIGVLQTMLPASLTPKDSTYNAPQIKYANYYELKADFDASVLNSTMQKILKKFDGRRLIKTSEISKSNSLNTLIDEGIIIRRTYEVTRYEPTKIFEYENDITLTEEQQKAFETINFGEEKTYLLKGVTGSGKTEVYFRLIDETLKEGKSAIVLVPEIALTPLMVSRALSYFNEEVAVLNSSLTNAQKYDQYRKIANGKAKIIIGTRSAIFAPAVKLGLIIIDEEHDESYKQDESMLLYNAKEVALLRSANKDMKVVFGSATPSVEMMAKAISGTIKLVELKNRYNGKLLPRVKIIDSTNKNNYSYGYEAFSDEMINSLKETIKNKEQAILLINSRGFSQDYTCSSCGHIFKCPKCELPLHYHKNSNLLYCHHCEFKTKAPKVCPECGGKEFKLGTFGIEKVEEEFNKIFKIPYLIMDSDRIKTGKQIEKALSDFNDKKAHVLIGTQLVSKGHDFKDVSFVGIINPDISLNFKNYRNREMTFNLLAQTIGRAGRNDKVGRACVQTKYIDDYAVINGAKQDYDEFYKNEIESRRKLNNPPFTSVCSFDIRAKNFENVSKFSKQIIAYINSLKMNNVIVLGPSFIRYKKGMYFSQVYLKYKKLNVVKSTIESIVNVYLKNSYVDLKINFNPYSF